MTSSLGYGVWAFLAAVTLAVWGLAHSRSGRRVFVPPSAALAWLATDPWLRVVLVLAWAWLGWHLFAR